MRESEFREEGKEKGLNWSLIDEKMMIYKSGWFYQICLDMQWDTRALAT